MLKLLKLQMISIVRLFLCQLIIVNGVFKFELVNCDNYTRTTIPSVIIRNSTIPTQLPVHMMKDFLELSVDYEDSTKILWKEVTKIFRERCPIVPRLSTNFGVELAVHAKYTKNCETVVAHIANLYRKCRFPTDGVKLRIHLPGNQTNLSGKRRACNCLLESDPATFADRGVVFDGSGVSLSVETFCQTSITWIPAIMSKNKNNYVEQAIVASPFFLGTWNDLKDTVKAKSIRDVQLLMLEAVCSTMKIECHSSSALKINKALTKSIGKHEKNGTWSGILGLLHRGEVNMGIHLLATTDVPWEVEMTPPVFTDYLGFVVRLKYSDIYVDRLTRPFYITTWGAIAITTVLVIILVHIAIVKCPGSAYCQPSLQQKSSISAITMNILAGLIDQGQFSLNRKSNSIVRIILSSWMILCLVLVNAYRGKMIQMLLLQQPKNFPETFHQLMNESDYKLGVFNGIIGEWLTTQGQSVIPQFEKSRYNSEANKSPMSCMKLTLTTDVACIGFRTMNYMYASELWAALDVPATVNQIWFNSNEKLIAAYGVWVIRRGSPLKKKVMSALGALSASGLDYKWREIALARIAASRYEHRAACRQFLKGKHCFSLFLRTHDENGKEVSLRGFGHTFHFNSEILRLKHVLSVFMLLGLGLCIGFVTFCIEHWLHNGKGNSSSMVYSLTELSSIDTKDETSVKNAF